MIMPLILFMKRVVKVNRTQYFVQEKGAMVIRANGKCEVCGKQLPAGGGDFSHKLGKKKHDLIRYGWEFINSRYNASLTCPHATGAKCNDKVDIGGKAGIIAEHVKYVYSMMGGCDD